MTVVFFTDRDLGTFFPDILQDGGIRVERHADHFPNDAPDELWLTRAGQEGWYCLTRDKRIRYRPNQKDAVMRAEVGLFILVGKVTHRELARNFVGTLPKVEQFIERHKRPFIAKVYRPSSTTVGKTPPRTGRVEIWLTKEEWMRGRTK